MLLMSRVGKRRWKSTSASTANTDDLVKYPSQSSYRSNTMLSNEGQLYKIIPKCHSYSVRKAVPLKVSDTKKEQGIKNINNPGLRFAKFKILIS